MKIAVKNLHGSFNFRDWSSYLLQICREWFANMLRVMCKFHGKLSDLHRPNTSCGMLSSYKQKYRSSCLSIWENWGLRILGWIKQDIAKCAKFWWTRFLSGLVRLTKKWGRVAVYQGGLTSHIVSCRRFSIKVDNKKKQKWCVENLHIDFGFIQII